MIPKVVFCPKCHKKVNVPKIAGQVTVLGDIKVECTCGNKIKINSK